MVDINEEFLSAIMSVYSDDVPFSPGMKTNAVEEFIAPVSRLYCSGIEPLIASSLIRLVQGDATTIQQSIGDKLGWSKGERNIVAALVLCSQRTSFGLPKTYMQNKTLDFKPSENQDWAQTRDAGVCSRTIASVLQIRQSDVLVLISACHGHEDSLHKLISLLDVDEGGENAPSKKNDANDKKKMTIFEVVSW